MSSAITGALTSGGQEITPKSSLSASKLSEDFDNFLLLLTTQLQNQDPSEPLDTSEFTSQLVQFASVEQQIDQTKQLELLVEKTGQNDFMAAANLVGKDVEVFGNKVIIEEGATNISKKLVYAHSNAVTDTKISVYNSSNNLIYTTTGISTAGKHEFVWDGKDSNQQSVPADTYTITIEELPFGETEYKPLASNIVDRVKEVLLVEGKIFVTIGSSGSFTVPFEDILAVSDPNS